MLLNSLRIVVFNFGLSNLRICNKIIKQTQGKGTKSKNN